MSNEIEILYYITMGVMATGTLISLYLINEGLKEKKGLTIPDYVSQGFRNYLEKRRQRRKV